MVTDFVREKNKNEYQARKRNQEEFTDTEQGYKDTIEGLKNDLKSEQTKSLKFSANDELAKKMENGRNLDDKQKDFIKLDFDDKFKISDPDKWKDELDTYIDLRVTEYGKVSSLLGIKPPDAENTTQNQTPGIPAAQQPLGSANKDLSDPAHNDFIPNPKGG